MSRTQRFASADRDASSAVQVHAIEARSLRLRRGGQCVLRDVDLAVGYGEAIALSGANGAGKTTLLHCLAGILRCTSGAVLWGGEPADNSAAQRGQVGFVGHESGLYLGLTGRENLFFAARMHGLSDASGRTAAMLDSFGLTNHADRRVGCLSRGTRQRLATARAVIHGPTILLLDEPFSGLDPDGREWLTGVLIDLQSSGCALVVSDHDPERAWDYADRALVVTAGRLYEYSTRRAHPRPSSGGLT